MTMLSEINARSPTIDESWLDAFRNQFYRGYTIELRSNHTPVPEAFVDMTPKLTNVPAERRVMSEVLTMSPVVANRLWRQVLDGNFPSLGPRVVTSLDEVHGRGNYIVIGNDGDFVFIWAPVYESNEFFARHWSLLRYCMEKGLVSEYPKLWGAGETVRENGSVNINHYSGSFEGYISSSLSLYNLTPETHYEDLIGSLSEKFETQFVFFNYDFELNEDHKFDDFGVKCPAIPASLTDFDPDGCYRYNVLPGVFKNFSLYDILLDKQTYEDVFQEASMFVRPGRLQEFIEEMYRLSTLVHDA